MTTATRPRPIAPAMPPVLFLEAAYPDGQPYTDTSEDDGEPDDPADLRDDL